MEETESDFGVHDISGLIEVRNEFGLRTELGKEQHNVNLEIRERR